MPFTAENVKDIPRVRAVAAMHEPDEPARVMFDIKDSDDEPHRVTMFKALAIDVVLRRGMPPNEAKGLVEKLAVICTDEKSLALFQPVLDAVDFIRREDAGEFAQCR
jgi:hypothetical protein